MIFTRSTTAALSVWLAFAGLAPAQQRDVPKLETPVVGIKTSTRFDPCAMRTYRGVVKEVKDGKVTLLGHNGDLKLKTLTFTATDLLAEGGYHEKATSACFTYLWADMKKGDSVCLSTILDHGDKVTYCVEIMIERRPGGKLPQGQRPQEERWFLPGSLLNDIDNGEDVSDEEIAKAFPGLPPLTPGNTGLPAGLNKEYQAKLDAIRAKKKEAELKAPPPEKKEK